MFGIFSGGSAYSYCGNMDQSVCCYVPRGARPIGLLPVLNKSKCGRKGNVAAAVGDRKRSDGLADLGEWPWHVRHLFFFKTKQLHVIILSLSLQQQCNNNSVGCVYT